MIDHVKIYTRDIERSRAFYAAALAPLDVRVLLSRHDPVSYGLGERFPAFWIEEGDGAPPVHVAFAARAPEAVDAFHAAALEAGGREHGAPGIRPRYHSGYYGAFVLDPDGYNVEAVCHAAGRRAGEAG